jgi:nicotinamide mononucleotide (NMN) deamidase PncC
MSFPPEILTKISTHLITSNQKISVAETAAGGLISAALLSVPGASAYFAGGATLYTLPSRKVYAGWTEEDVKKYK